MIKIKLIPHVELIHVGSLLKTLPRFKGANGDGYLGIIGDVLYEHAKLTETKCLNLNVPIEHVARKDAALARLELISGLSGKSARMAMSSIRRTILDDTTIKNRLETMSPYNEVGWYNAAQRPDTVSIGRYRISVDGVAMGIDKLYDTVLPELIRRNTTGINHELVLDIVRNKFRISEVLTNPYSVITKAAADVYS